MTFNVVKDWNHGTCTSAMWAIRSVRLYIFFFSDLAVWGDCQMGAMFKSGPYLQKSHAIFPG